MTGNRVPSSDRFPTLRRVTSCGWLGIQMFSLSWSYVCTFPLDKDYFFHPVITQTQSYHGFFHIQSDIWQCSTAFFCGWVMKPSRFLKLVRYFRRLFIFFSPNGHFMRIWVTKLYFIVKNLCDSVESFCLQYILYPMFACLSKLSFLSILPGTLTSSSNGKSVLLTNFAT